MSFPLTEKTLELNILKNMLEDIQNNFSSTAYLYGFSLRHESTTGMDASIRVPGNPIMLALQFKKAFKKSCQIYFFDFNNNAHRNQHNMLFISAFLMSPQDCVFYALPTIADMNELSRSSPNFLKNTLLLNPIDVGPINDQKVHSIILDTPSRTCSIFSEFMKRDIRLHSWEEISESIRKEKIGTRVYSFLDKIKSERKLREEIFLGKERPTRVYLRSLMMPI
jgi:hypothetical protein